jgi:nicotinamide-nucleotide amidase
MKIEVINMGTEILLGHVTNTHLGYLARELFSIGERIERQCTVPDGEAIRLALKESLQRSDLIIITGGLGPTSDDITREIAAELLDLPLTFVPEIWDHIVERFKRRNKIPGENNRKQALVPAGAEYLQNQNGTAPGLIIPFKAQTIVLLPGPPRELIGMWEKQAFPWLKEHLFQSTQVIQKQWRILGIGESDVEREIEPKLREIGATEIGYCARAGEVDLRLISSDKALLQKADQIITGHFQEAIYSLGTESMEEVVVRLARSKGIQISTAESCTGGLIAHRLTLVSGSSDVFGFGWVTYANEAKMQELGVAAEILSRSGAVSRETVEAMASGALRQSKADIAVSVSGIAGPTGGTAEKPVGTCWIGWATKDRVWSEKFILSQNRETFKMMASQHALDGIRRWMMKAA